LEIQGSEDKMKKKLLKFKSFWNKHGLIVNSTVIFISICLAYITKIKLIYDIALISSIIYVLFDVLIIFIEEGEVNDRKRKR
jgi:hypothetical protein